METNLLVEYASKFGLGVVLSIIIVLIFKRFINRVMDSFSEERANYLALINKKDETVNNHIEHLTQAVSDLVVGLKEQKTIIDCGFKNIIDIINYLKTK